jgi:lipoprotein-anchoring transpeptidase ErfK/SrfK
MHWAIKRYRTEFPPQEQARYPIGVVLSQPQVSRTRMRTIFPWGILLIAIFLGTLIWFGAPAFSLPSTQTGDLLVLAQELVNIKTITPTFTPTFTSTPTYTSSPTPTNTRTYTPSPTSTDTPTFTPSLTPSDTPTHTPSPIPTDTNTPIPTATKAPKDEQDNIPPQVSLPPGVKKGEIWIDIDLSNQLLQIYKGKNLLNTFVVSTGTWRTPTITGQYRIYVKYPAADMAGPGYYLPRVPYVMYFYKGYGIHGTYWHNNFGTPMSHGCVNLRTDNAEWVYNKSSVGTVVNIHY